MISRVTTQTMAATALRNLQSTRGELARMQDRAATLDAISKPSDDPSKTADSLRIRAAQSATTQYASNIDDGRGWLTAADSALSSATGILGQVRDLTVQGANDGALSPTQKEAIAQALEGLRSDLFAQANANYLGRSIFAGNSDTGAAFAADLSHSGAAGSSVQRRIDDGATVRVDADGAAAFGVGAASVFALVDTIVADLRAGTNVGAHLGSIDASLKAVLSEQASVGTRDARIQRAREANVEQSGALESQRADVEDLDLTRVILDMQMQQVTYQSALGVTAKVLQPTLMDFLR